MARSGRLTALLFGVLGGTLLVLCGASSAGADEPPGGVVTRSTDGGATFANQGTVNPNELNSVSTDDDPPPTADAVTAVSQTTVAVGDAGTILRSTDTGATWTQVGSGVTGADLNGVSATNNDDFVVAAGDSGTIVRSPDDATTWGAVASGTTANLNGVATDDLTSYGYLVVGDAGTVLRSVDTGVTWAPVASGTTANLRGAHLDDTAGVALAVGDSGTILRSTTGGASWAPAVSGTSATLRGVACLYSSDPGPECDDLFISDVFVHVAVGDGGTILRSLDLGVTWVPVGTGVTTQNLYSVAGRVIGGVARFVVVGDTGTALRSDDAGATWSLVSTGTTANLRGVTVSNSNPLGFVAVGGIPAGAPVTPAAAPIETEVEDVWVSELPFTGSEPGAFLLAGLVLVLSGLLVLGARRLGVFAA